MSSLLFSSAFYILSSHPSNKSSGEFPSLKKSLSSLEFIATWLMSGHKSLEIFAFLFFFSLTIAYVFQNINQADQEFSLLPEVKLK